MKILVLILAVYLTGGGAAPNGTGVTGDPADIYEVVTASRRSFDRSPPMEKNGASSDEEVRAKFGNDYFLREDSVLQDEVNSSLPLAEGSGVIQKVVRASPAPMGPHEEETLAERVMDSLNMPVVRTVAGTEWLLDVYNPHRWQAGFLPGARSLSPDCKGDLRTYLRALHNGTIWAAKMTDASGRYSSQFFFGNDFWLGSHTLCQELQNPLANRVVPPFKVTFHVAILHLRLPHELTPRRVLPEWMTRRREVIRHPIRNPPLNDSGRQISLGVCLPRSCSGKDITDLLQPEPTSTSPHALQVLRVRPIPGQYSLLRDTKLHIIGFVTAILLVLIAVGTAYENHLERQQRRRDKSPPSHDTSDKLASPLDCPRLARGKGNSDSDISTADSFRDPMSLTGQVFLSFSALSNARKILHCGAAPKDSLTCVHGLRFLSLAWVILVHTYLQVFAIAENKTLRTLTERNFMFQTVSNATFSVDTFFFISGLLVTYLYFKTLRTEPASRRNIDCSTELQAGARKFFTLLGYRFIRLTPAYLFVLLIAELNMRWIKNGSVFEPVSLDQINCDLYWWRNVLYINSLYPMKDMCMLWSWYLANDTQFYIIGILILLVSVRHVRIAVVALVVFMVSSWLVTGFISIKYEYKVRVEEPFALFDQLYDKPWLRLGPYLVGMFSGWFLFKTKCKVTISKFTTVACWFLSLLVLASLVYGVLNAQLGVTGSAFYVALGHTAWGLALAWIVIACCTGHGGYINTVLSCRLLHPLSRLTYCAYLIHPVLMANVSFRMDGPLHLHNALVLILYFGNIVASFLLSFVISMAFEAPVVRLLKITLSPKPKRTNSIEE